MPTATHGAFTGVMTFATAAQAGYWERYKATEVMLRDMMDALAVALDAGSVSPSEFTDKMLCLNDLYQQNEALWASQGPTVRWLQIEPIEEVIP